HYAERDLLLPRSLSELYGHVRDFFVVVEAPRDNVVIGVGALGVCWEDLAEIKSLAVVEDHQGKGYGARLVDACLKDAHSLGLKNVFALTYVPEFFKKLGFREIEKSILPHKVWADCLKCPKFPDCDEIALIVEL
ncbi:MAG: N-acetyltransferase, partial [Deltaproteobacteria bacterium]|nr:N-acetyltransferase [Deltaproteobacteria bacterium]